MSHNKNTAESSGSHHKLKWVALSASFFSFVVTFWIWPVADSNQAVVASTLMAVIVLWVTEAIPLYVSALTGS